MIEFIAFRVTCPICQAALQVPLFQTEDQARHWLLSHIDGTHAAAAIESITVTGVAVATPKPA